MVLVFSSTCYMPGPVLSIGALSHFISTLQKKEALLSAYERTEAGRSEVPCPSRTVNGGAEIQSQATLFPELSELPCHIRMLGPSG